MRKRSAIGMALTAAGVLALGAPATAAGQEQEIGLLFAQTANRGTMKPIKGSPRFSLKLFGVNPQVVWFSDRPQRQSGQIPVPDFTRAWVGFGFDEDPPNAALTLLDAGDRHDTLVVELLRPDYKKQKNRIRYTAQILDAATGNLSHLESDRDHRVKRRFRAASLFIDDATGNVVNGCLIQPQTICERDDLHEADLTGVDLRWADMFGANLSRATLTRANLAFATLEQALLSEANLSEANLFEADLSDSGLQGANLSGASLRAANVFGANLSGANLSGADLTGADLTGADLTGARFCQTRMPDGRFNNKDC